MGEGQLLWSPPDELVERSAMTRYMRWLADERGVRADDYEALWRWSTEEPDAFWRSIWDYFGVVSDTEPEAALADDSMPGAVWFPGTRINYAEHLFRDKPDDRVAIFAASEVRELHEVTWGELRELVGRIRAGLVARGVESGDRVVGYVPNIPEAIAMFLAAASLGAVWSSCSPDFGAQAVVDRFAQTEPKVLVAVDGYRYNGKAFDRRETVQKLMERMPSLEHTILLPYLGCGELEGAEPWDDLVAEPGELTFDRVAFEHPLWILYSSGTTGLPKAIVHSQGGVLLEHLKKLNLHVDAREGDRLFWFTTTGWMMWNFIVSGLLTEAAIVLFDGSPGYPDMGVLWELAADTGMTCFGTSAGFIQACMNDGVHPREGRDLSRLRAVGSTGSPLSPEGYDWIYEELGEDTWLFSTSGGTDVVTAFVGGVPILPVYRGELQGRALGAALEAWNEDGEPVVGEVGELVITKPMPSMPIFFWDDPDGARLRESYFDMFPGVWRHGDWIELTERGTAIITGRSDSTINRGGIRMGTSEIYRSVLALDEISDALVLDVDGWMPLFVVLADGARIDDELRKKIAARVRDDCSPRHVPNEVFAIDEVPRTLSNKVLEVPVKKILQGTPAEKAASRDSLLNPEALDWFVRFAQERKRGAEAA
jgi:acetoacetyl-CoA synthetase